MLYSVCRYYWGGASHEGQNCACGETGTCVNPDTKCNCDANDDVMRKDEGYLEYKLDLPVTQFLAGDTGELIYYRKEILDTLKLLFFTSLKAFVAKDVTISQSNLGHWPKRVKYYKFGQQRQW